MKKYKITNRLRFTAFLSSLILVLVCITGSLMGTFKANAGSEITYTEYQVKYGDTLWDIAKEYGNPKADIRKTIYDISILNNVDAQSLREGMVILVPTE